MRKLLLALVAVTVVAFICWLAALYPFLRAMNQRDTDARTAFKPIAPLCPQILDNAFGVYSVTFTETSLLQDTNVADILSLNKLPAEFELTVVIATPSVTDSSISTLAKLLTTDTLIVDDSGLSESGIQELAAKLPEGVLWRPKRNGQTKASAKTESQSGWQPFDAP